MASNHGFLPVPKEVVLEIQLNKLINDFLFPGADNYNATGVRESDGRDELRPMIPSHDDPAGNGTKPPWTMDEPPCNPLENGNLIENRSNAARPSCVADLPCAIPENASPKMPQGSQCTSFIQRKSASFPTVEEVRLDMSEDSLNPCNENKPQHNNKLKVFCLGRAHSMAGSLFCFAMERREHHGAKKEEERKSQSERRSIKLTRIVSLPCQSKLRSAAENEVKHTCRKPPKPPRSSSGRGSCPLLSGHASADAIFVLHGASRRARLDRRKKHAATSSSNAFMWALIVTFCFAVAMIGEGSSVPNLYFSGTSSFVLLEGRCTCIIRSQCSFVMPFNAGFWTQNSTKLAVDATINATAAHSYMLSIQQGKIPNQAKQ